MTNAFGGGVLFWRLSRGDIPGPMPIVRDTDDEGEREFGAVDEVEYAYGE